MNCKALLSVVILLICTNIRAAVPLPKFPWRDLKNDTSLKAYRHTLLSEDEFPFLKTCYDPGCCEESDKKLCSLYFDAVLWANRTSLPAIAANESTVVAQTKQDGICNELISLQKVANLYRNQTESFKNSENCVNLCARNDTLKVRPVCLVSSWLLNRTFKASTPELEKVDKHAVVQPAKDQNSEVPTSKQNGTAAAQSPEPEAATSTKVPLTSPASVQTNPLDKETLAHNNSQDPAIFNPDTDDSDDGYESNQGEQIVDAKEPNENTKSKESVDVLPNDPFFEESSSNFFAYFLFGMFSCILLYVIYNNKSKILALILEGRRSQGGRNGRRKHTAAYRKLDTNLEEAITSSTTSGRTSQIIY